MQADRYRGCSDFKQNKTTIVDDYVTTSQSDGTRFRTQHNYIGTLGWQHAFSDKHLLNVDLQSGETQNSRGGDMDYLEDRTIGSSDSVHNDYDAHDRYSLTKRLIQLAADYTWHVNERGDLFSVKSRNRHDWYSLEYTESNLFDKSTGELIRYEGTRGYEKEYHWDCDEQFDYTLQYRPSGKLETGYQYVTYSETGDYNIKYWNRPLQQFEWQDDLHAPFDYRRQTHSLYAAATDHFGPLELNAGLRMDRVLDRMDITVKNASRDIRRTEFYPSAHAAYRTTNAGTFTLGYARRVNRPGIWKLEPYITYEDYYTKIIGNPDIRPEYIQSIELSYNKTWKGGHSLNLAAYNRWHSDVVDIIRRAYEPGITLDSIINAGNRIVQGMEGSVVIQPAKRWTSTLNGHLNHYRFTATYQGCTDTDGLCYEIGWVNQFKLPYAIGLQFDSHVVGPHHLTQGREKAYCYFDLALRHRMLSDKLNLGLVAHDVFHTARYSNWRHTADLSSETWVRPKFPNITLSVSYYFNTKVKEKGGRSELTEDAVFEGKEF